jgi:hypothetical protein
LKPASNVPFLSRLRLPFIFLSAAVFLLGIGLRLYDLTDPPLDFHATRQLRSAIIARGFYYEMLPGADEEVSELAQSLAASLETYELPVFEWVVALTYRLVGGEHLWIARVYNTLFWGIAGYTLFLLARRLSNGDGAIISLGYMMLLPFGIIASRSFQPDTLMVMWVVLATYCVHRWTETQSWKWTLAVGVTAGLAVLIKVFAVFPVAGLLIAALLSSLGFRGCWKNPKAFVMGVIAAAIPAAYYLLTIGDTANSFFSFWTLSFIPLLKQGWFYIRWIDFIDGLVNFELIILGLISVFLLTRRDRALVLGLWIGYLIYGLFVPYQIHTHEYYSLVLVPIVALSLAQVGSLILGKIEGEGKFWQGAALLVLVFSLALPAWTVRSGLLGKSYRGEPGGWALIGEALPDDGQIIALTHDYGNRLAYYGWKRVQIWPSLADNNLNVLRGGNNGEDNARVFAEKTECCRYFLVTQFGELEKQAELKNILTTNFPVYAEGDGYQVFDLKAEQ